MELYAARHGETLSNLENRLTGGGGDSPLTEKGIEQAKTLGKSLENLYFDALYASPLNRAIDTMRIAFGEECKFFIDDRLAEIGLGIMEGMVYDDASAAYPDSGMGFWLDPVSYIPPPNGEKLTDMIKRVSSFLDEIVKENNKRVFVMTHGYLLRVLHACTIDKSISAIAKSPGYSNCEMVRYIYEEGIWKSV